LHWIYRFAIQIIVICGWSLWDSWGPCNVTCGNGQQRRRRSCNNPAPANGGTYCQGEEYDYISCTLPVCPVNGGWSSWISGACNATCGIGQQSRRRYCNTPSQANGGADCKGEEDDLISCTRSECAEQQSGNTPIVVGTVIGVLVIVILLVTFVTYAKRRWHNSKKKPDYEITDMTKVKAHIYGETHANHAYQNDQHTAEIEVTTTDNVSLLFMEFY
ncbi:hemicentin-1 lowquality protein, partial [Mytilus galloprovincialis]